MTSTDDQILAAPIVFRPYFKRVLWGGSKICRYKGISSDATDIGESWEISALPGQESRVDGGLYADMTLQELSDRFGAQLLGDSVLKRYGGKFPMLIKFIDANDRLSVQVHPDDKMAAERHSSLGKSEMWYIIDAEPGAKIYSGLTEAMTPEQYEQRLLEGSITDVLAEYETAPGEVFYLPAGRVHAIGPGNFLAEIQESSDITYRIYDYGRRDSAGRPRELHTDMAREAIDYKVRDTYRSPSPSPDEKNCEIAACEHFTVRRLIIEGPHTYTFSRDSFTALMCLEGEVTLNYPGGTLTLRQGHTALLPAVMRSIELTGKALLLCAQA